jgi:(2R)-ethylmalonyl-CoA mutase
VQLPAWNEARGLPRPWDQQWSLRLQQIVAHETDLLEFEDIFAGSPVIEAKVAELCADVRSELERVAQMGGAVAAIENSYMKRRLVEANARRLASIESGERMVIGVNAFVETEPSPLAVGEHGYLAVEDDAERAQVERLASWRAGRDEARVAAAVGELENAARAGRDVMEASIACAHAGVTTGEWGEAMRRAFGAWRAPTGVGLAAGAGAAADGAALNAVRARVEGFAKRFGRRPKMLVGKPGLDGHSNGAEQIAVRARDCGFEVVYEGIRLTPAEIVNAAVEEDVHVIGLSVLSGSHRPLIAAIQRGLAEAGCADVPLVVGGIVPPADAEALKANGVVAVYTPKDFDLTAIMADIVTIVERMPTGPAKQEIQREGAEGA